MTAVRSGQEVTVSVTGEVTEVDSSSFVIEPPGGDYGYIFEHRDVATGAVKLRVNRNIPKWYPAQVGDVIRIECKLYTSTNLVLGDGSVARVFGDGSGHPIPLRTFNDQLAQEFYGGTETIHLLVRNGKDYE